MVTYEQLAQSNQVSAGHRDSLQDRCYLLKTEPDGARRKLLFLGKQACKDVGNKWCRCTTHAKEGEGPVGKSENFMFKLSLVLLSK